MTDEKKPTVTERPLDGIVSTDGIWWCNSHQMEATHYRNGRHICDPKLGGITIPCFVVFFEHIEI
jgi:hypothetical protein